MTGLIGLICIGLAKYQSNWRLPLYGVFASFAILAKHMGMDGYDASIGWICFVLLGELYDLQYVLKEGMERRRELKFTTRDFAVAVYGRGVLLSLMLYASVNMFLHVLREFTSEYPAVDIVGPVILLSVFTEIYYAIYFKFSVQRFMVTLIAPLTVVIADQYSILRSYNRLAGCIIGLFIGLGIRYLLVKFLTINLKLDDKPRQ